MGDDGAARPGQRAGQAEPVVHVVMVVTGVGPDEAQ